MFTLAAAMPTVNGEVCPAIERLHPSTPPSAAVYGVLLHRARRAVHADRFGWLIDGEVRGPGVRASLRASFRVGAGQAVPSARREPVDCPWGQRITTELPSGLAGLPHPSGHLDAVAQAEPGGDVGQVGLDGGQGEEEFLGDLTVGASSGDQAGDLDLPG